MASGSKSPQRSDEGCAPKIAPMKQSGFTSLNACNCVCARISSENVEIYFAGRWTCSLLTSCFDSL